MVNRAVKRGLALLGMAGGVLLGYYLQNHLFLLGLDNLLGGLAARLGLVAGCMVLGGLVGYGLAPWCIRQILEASNWIEYRVQRIPTVDLVFGAVGAIVGVVVAYFLSEPLHLIPLLGPYLPTVVALTLGYVGLVVGLKKKEDLGVAFWSKLASKERSAAARGEKGSGTATAGEAALGGKATHKLLDTSVIIDGRIADICQTGFIEGPLVIPHFILEELRHIADSSDALKRNRGRRGLDILNKIQKELSMQVQITERDPAPDQDVDGKLLRLAKMMGGVVLTNDFNLNKVAELQGVRVLNINELSNALKPVVLPGEEMQVHVVKDGKETGQGVAYLDDGTMIVVDGGRKFIGDTVGVLVTSVLQTAAGRMIFAKPKLHSVQGKISV